MNRQPRLIITLCSILAASVSVPLGCGETQRGPELLVGGAGGERSDVSGATSVSGAADGGAPSASHETIPCTDDKPCLATGQLCDRQRFVCGNCLTAANCEKNELCSEGTCVSFTPCTVTRQCGPGAVCDPSEGFCVECVADANCDLNQVCVNTVCRAPCKSDQNCEALAQLCDETNDYCVECTNDADCGEGSHCSADSCEKNVCDPGGALCVNDELLTCGVHGSRFTLQVCDAGCSEAGGAHCLDAGNGGATAGGAPNEGGRSANGGEGGRSANGGEVGATMAAAGAAGDTGQHCSPPNPTPDGLAVPDCGYVGAQSRDQYGGIATVTLSGIVQNAPGAPTDPFYSLDGQNPSQALEPCPQCVVFNRASEGDCVCQVECPGKAHKLSDFLIDAYPPFNPEHSYTVRVDLGPAAPERLHFAFGDCGCNDNSGSYALSIACGE